MDRGWATPPEVNSFHYDEEHHRNSPDSGKKRKLQYEQLGLPMSKHKFRGRCSSPAQGSPSPSHLETEETTEESKKNSRSVDSSKDSNSFVSGYDDVLHAEMSSGNPTLACGASTSSCRPQDDCEFRSKLYSLESRMAKNADPSERYSDLEDEIQVEPEFEDLGEQLPAFGLYGDYIEECPDASIEEYQLYSNGVPPNTLVHPPGRWGLKKDARVDTRKPTIDQEFEQYFSMLML